MNLVSPSATTRMTENLMPDDMVESLGPEQVAPVVALLCSRDCPDTGLVIEAMAGRIARSAIVRGTGITYEAKKPVDAEWVLANWKEITSLKDAGLWWHLQQPPRGVVSSASATPRRDSRTPLGGVRVLDFSQVVSGPICGRMLADLGADVVKVEPIDGDIIRGLPPQVGDDAMSPYFSWVNAGKRSLGVDLRDPKVAALVRELALDSDVVLENFRPGVLERFGMGSQELREANPRLIYCSISGWGADNSWSGRRAYAAMVQAEAGRVELDARLRDAPPEQSPHVDGDITPGMLAVSAICAALFQRERDGRGQHLDVSMAEALLYTDEWTSTELTGYDGPRQPDTWLYPVFRVADGTAVAFMGDPHPRLPEIAAALSDEPVGHVDTREEALAIVSDLVSRFPDFPTVEARLDTFGFLIAEVRSTAAVADTPWAREREVFREVEPGIRVTASPYRGLRRRDRGTRPRPAPRGALPGRPRRAAGHERRGARRARGGGAARRAPAARAPRLRRSTPPALGSRSAREASSAPPRSSRGSARAPRPARASRPARPSPAAAPGCSCARRARRDRSAPPCRSRGGGSGTG